MGVLFILIGVGFIATKAGIMNEDFNRSFSKFIINIASPAMILNSVMDGERQLSNPEVFMLLGVSFASFAVVILLAKAVPPLLRYDKKRNAMIRMLFIFSNTGFMGFPVIAALFGNEAVFYAALFNIPFNLLNFSYGIHLASNGKVSGMSPKVLLSPAILSALLALVIYLARIPIPAIISSPIGYLQGANIPGAMCLIGSSLAMAPLKKLFTDIRIYLFSLLKLVALPAIIFALMRLIPLPEICMQITVVMWMLPCATNNTMLTAIYDGDVFESSKGVFVTTLLSCITLPLMCWLLFL